MRHLNRNLKRSLSAIILGLALGCSESQVDFSELVERDGVYYLKFSNVPFTGETSGRVAAQLRDGKLRGQVLRFFEDGNLASKENYLNGIKHGVSEHYTSKGTKRQHISYKNGLFHGEVWEETSVTDKWAVRHATFKEGFLEGPYKTTYPNGQIAFAAELKGHRVASSKVEVRSPAGDFLISIPFSAGEIHGTVQWANGCSQHFVNGVPQDMQRPETTSVDMDMHQDSILASAFEERMICMGVTTIPKFLLNPESVWLEAPRSW